MVYSIQKLYITRTINFIFVILLTSCNSNLHYESWANSNESYLDAEPLIKLCAPIGITLPTLNNDYNIPDNNINNIAEDKMLIDIRPPAQSLKLPYCKYKFIDKKLYN